jgi:hypothetical protein
MDGPELEKAVKNVFEERKEKIKDIRTGDHPKDKEIGHWAECYVDTEQYGDFHIRYFSRKEPFVTVLHVGWQVPFAQLEKIEISAIVHKLEEEQIKVDQKQPVIGFQVRPDSKEIARAINVYLNAYDAVSNLTLQYRKDLENI